MKRHTRQRRILEALIERAPNPLSASELHRLAVMNCPGLGLATVYRALNDWQQEGCVGLVELPGEPPRFEAANKPHHHHFQCRECSRVFDLPGCPGNMEALLPRGFTLERHEVVLYGLCSGCA